MMPNGKLSPTPYDLPSLGWVKTETVITRWKYQRLERTTYWKKDGKEFPQHFALALERWKMGIWMKPLRMN